jgi:hypothetical protein
MPPMSPLPCVSVDECLPVDRAPSPAAGPLLKGGLSVDQECRLTGPGQLTDRLRHLTRHILHPGHRQIEREGRVELPGTNARVAVDGSRTIVYSTPSKGAGRVSSNRVAGYRTASFGEFDKRTGRCRSDETASSAATWHG